MNDLISRQAAVDEALMFFVEYLGGAFDEDSQMLLAQRMNSIPSADITETELCKKCQEATERVLNNQGEKIKELESAKQNDDFISRQAAIEAYNEAMRELVEEQMKELDLIHFSECSFNTTDCLLIAKRIEELPSIPSEKHQLSQETSTNDDFISRQDAMKEFARHDCTNGEVQFFTGKDVQEILKVIPSAEPVNKDAISREGLLKSWDELSIRGRTEFDQVIMTIPALPSAEKVHGEWVNEWKGIDGGRMYGACCSVCHALGHSGYNFCPNCGAKMDKGED